MAKNLRHSTIGFTVSGNIEKLERANALLDKMPEKAKKLGSALGNFKVDESAFKGLERLERASNSAQKALKDLPDRKDVKINTSVDDTALNKVDDKLTKVSKTRTVKVKTNTTEAKEQITQLGTRIDRFGDKSESAFHKLSTSAKSAANNGVGFLRSKLRSLNETTDTGGHLFSKMMGAALVSNAVVSSWSALTSGVKEATKAGWEYSKQQDQMLATWTTLGGSRQMAKSMRNEINQRSVATGQDTDLINEAAQGFYHLKSNRKETRDMSNALFNMSDAVGLTQEQTKSVTQDMVHTLSGGVVQTGDLNVIGQYFPMFNEAMEKYESKIHHGAKITGQDLREMAKTGKISASDYEKVFEQLGNVKYSKAAETMLTTFNGMERTIKARVPALMSAMEQPFMTQTSGFYGGISKWVSAKKTEKEFDDLGSALNKSVTKIAGAFGKAFNIKDGPQFADKAIQGLTKQVTKLGDYIAKHPNQIKDFFDTTKTIGKTTLTVYTSALKDMLPVLKLVGKFADEHPKVFGTIFGGLVAVNASAGILKHTLGGILTVTGALRDVVKGGGSWISKLTSIGKTAPVETSTVAPEVGSRVARNSSTGSKLLTAGTAAKAIGWGAVGLDVGSSAVSAFKDGLDTKKGKGEAWTAGGKAVGAGLGLALSGGNPLVAGIGSAIGGSITNYIEKNAPSIKSSFSEGQKGKSSKAPWWSDQGIANNFGKFTKVLRDTKPIDFSKIFKGFKNIDWLGKKSDKNSFQNSPIYKLFTGKIKFKAPKNFDPVKWFKKKISGLNPKKWIEDKLSGLTKMKLPNPFKNFHPIKDFKATISGLHPIKWLESKLSGLTKMKIPNPFKNFHPIKWFEDTLAGFNPGKIISGFFSKAGGKVSKIAKSIGLEGHATGGRISKNGYAVVGENGFEILQRGKKFGVVGRNGAQLANLRIGDQIYKHTDAVKMMNGQFKHRLPNFASGTTKLKTSRTSASVKVANSDDGLVKTAKTTKKSMSTISKSITKGYTDSNKKSTKQLKSMSKANKSTLKSLTEESKRQTHKFQTNTVGDFDDAQKGADKQMSQMRKGVMAYNKSIDSNFSSTMGKFPGYAKSGIKGAISSLNQGMSGVNTALSQFGGSKSVLKLAHYAKGTVNGAISHDHLGVLNDAKTGPRQETLIRDGRAMFPQGENTVVALKRGDRILNGSDTERAYGQLPHYKKGTASLKNVIEKNHKDPTGAFKSEFTSKLNSGVNTAVGRAANTNDKGGSASVGNPWSSAVWSAFANAMSGSGAGGAWGSPGMPVTDRFGAPRSFGSHDGVDFSSSIGSPILAVHGGTVAQIGSPGHHWPESQLGKIIWVKSSDGYQEIYQEFGGMNNIKVSAGDTIKTGQRIATLGALQGAGSGAHVHIGVSKGSVWDHGGSSTAGWLDVTKMHGKSSGTPKAKSKDTALDKYVKKQLAGQIKWIGKNLSDDDAGSVTGSLSGSQSSKARQLAALLKKAYPSATNAGAAAIVGNWLLESGLNSSIRNSIGASGLGQWLGGRFNNLKRYASKHGKSWSNAGTQVSFALNGEGSDSSIFKSVLGGHGSVSALATKFSNSWERGGYTAQHVADAMKVAKMLNLNANGGWSKNGKLNIFGEINGEPEVAINPARSSADGLIAQAANARAKVAPNGLASKMSKYEQYQEDAKERKNVMASLMKSLRAGTKKTAKKTQRQPQIVISPTINFNGPVDKSTADYATKNITSEIKKVVLQVMSQQYGNAFDELGLED